MSITITDSPIDYSPVYSPNIYVVDAGSLINEDNFKYIAGVYDGSTKLAELKAYPNPQYGWGKFDISDVLQAELDISIDFDLGIYSASDGVKEIQVRFGWEYINSSGIFVRVENNENDSNFYFNGSPNYTEFIELRDLDPNHPYVMTSGTAYDKYPLTSRRTVETYEWTRQWLYYLSDSYLVSRRFQIEDLDTGNIDYIDRTVPLNNNTTGKLIGVRVDKGFVEANTSLSNLENWRVRTTNNVNTSSSEWITFKLMRCNRWTPYSLYYLNRWGGIDSLPFTGRSTKEVKADRVTYKTDPRSISSSGVVNYKTETHSVKTSWTEITERLELSTDWIEYSTKDSAIDLMTSPKVWMETEDGIITPVTVVQDTFKIEDKHDTQPIMISMVVEYQQPTKRQQT